MFDAPLDTDEAKRFVCPDRWNLSDADWTLKVKSYEVESKTDERATVRVVLADDQTKKATALSVDLQKGGSGWLVCG